MIVVKLTLRTSPVKTDNYTFLTQFCHFLKLPEKWYSGQSRQIDKENHVSKRESWVSKFELWLNVELTWKKWENDCHLRILCPSVLVLASSELQLTLRDTDCEARLLQYCGLCNCVWSLYRIAPISFKPISSDVRPENHSGLVCQLPRYS